MKKLPIGIQTFSDIIIGNYCYADKTPLIERLVNEGKFYFLSRPRRFGKSLLIDTIAEAFQGSKELFAGLYLDKNWDWKQKYPVIRVDFAQGILTSPQQLDTSIMEMLHVAAKMNGISLQRQETHLAFAELIRELHHKTGQQVVVLVDEYDKPILDNITNPETSKKQRDGLRNFYSVL
ncbi:MAG: AAA family ATPase, partial [Desulfobulbaceae bacterium]|nr:AAA family ATPase [Desulfobulbaceae bacterium]